MNHLSTLRAPRPPVLLVLLLVALAAAAPLAAAPQEGGGDEAALGGLDPVALVAGHQVPGDPALAVEHAGLRYLFADAASRERFAADPGRFAVQGDGTCPVVSSATARPSIFTVYDGHIYTFATEACIEKFRLDPEYYAAKVADPDSVPASAPIARKVAILIYDGVELLDFAGPGEVFAATGEPAFEVFTVAPTAGPVTSQGFLTLTPEHTFADSPWPEVLVVPGGNTRNLMNDEATLAWVAKVAEKADLVLSVCTGAMVLARAGVLDGLEATTHSRAVDYLAEIAPQTTVVRDRRFVDNGRVITAAGVSAGIDAALYAVEKLVGPKTAGGTARYMEYAWQPAAESDTGAAR